MEAAISDTLPMSMLVRMDIPDLVYLLKKLPGPAQSSTGNALLVVTLTQADFPRKVKEAAQQRWDRSGVSPKLLEHLGGAMKCPESRESVPVEEDLPDFSEDCPCPHLLNHSVRNEPRDMLIVWVSILRNRFS